MHTTAGGALDLGPTKRATGNSIFEIEAAPTRGIVIGRLEDHRRFLGSQRTDYPGDHNLIIPRYMDLNTRLDRQSGNVKIAGHLHGRIRDGPYRSIQNLTINIECISIPAEEDQ